MLVYVKGAKCIGIEAVPVTVEVDISSGIGIHLVGLADAAVKESLLRTITALKSVGFRIPGKRIVINLAPADMHKKGSGYDLPIAVGIIAASGQMELPLLDRFIVMGELGLDGSVRNIPGALPIAEMAARIGSLGCILPFESATEACGYDGTDLYGVRNLEDVLRVLSANPCGDLLVRGNDAENWKEPDSFSGKRDNVMDFSEIVGQETAKRGLEVAAAGGHNVLLIGPPGAGKSSLSRATADILPPMTREEAFQTSKIYSVAGKGFRGGGLMTRRPFRSPHYSASVAALLGGGSDTILPGEVSLAHNGVLFIDELCEAPKSVIEMLRSPMEDRKVTISRLRSKIEYPASFMLIAATNPCPCGHFGDGDKCTCPPHRRNAYLSKLSGPLLDRIDLHLWLKPVNVSELVTRTPRESSAAVARRVVAARQLQAERLKGSGISCNAQMNSRQVQEHCRLSAQCRAFLEKVITDYGFSARACDRILKLSRTIADLSESPEIAIEHISEAVGYRSLDRLGL